MATLYEYYNTGADADVQIYGVNWAAQTFTPSTAHKITSVKLKLFRYGSPGTITVSIRATDASGHPTGSDLCSGTTNGNTLTTNPTGEWREITLGDGYDVAASTKYAIVARATSGSGLNRFNWLYDSTSPTYAGGNYEYSNNSGATWTGYTVADFMFEDWGEPLGTHVTIEVPLATVSSQAYAPTMSLGRTIDVPLATVSGEALVPTLVRDMILSPPLAAVSAEALSPEIIAGYGVIISVPLALVSAEALPALLSLGVSVDVPLAEVDAQAYVPRVLNMRIQAAVRSLAAFRVLNSIREEERL